MAAFGVGIFIHTQNDSVWRFMAEMNHHSDNVATTFQFEKKKNDSTSHEISPACFGQ